MTFIFINRLVLYYYDLLDYPFLTENMVYYHDFAKNI